MLSVCQLLSVSQPYPAFREWTTLQYAVAGLSSILPGVQVERVVSSLDVQEVALTLGYPVIKPAEGMNAICGFSTSHCLVITSKAYVFARLYNVYVANWLENISSRLN